MLSAEDEALIKQLAGVDAVYGVAILPEHLAAYARGNALPTLFTPFSPAEGFAMSRDLAVRSVVTPGPTRSMAVHHVKAR